MIASSGKINSQFTGGYPAILALAQSCPAILFGLPVYILTVLTLLRYSKINKNILLNITFGLSILVLCLISQIFLVGKDVSIIAMVSDGELRELITKGQYSMQNGINNLYFVKFASYIIITGILISLIGVPERVASFVNAAVYASVFSFLLVFIAVTVLGDQKIRYLLSYFTSLGAENYLTADEFGYRISGFFHEPSQSSVFIGTILAIKFKFFSGFKSRSITFAVLLLIFALSRSITSIVVFLVALYFLDSSRIKAAIGIGLLFFIPKTIIYLAAQFDGNNLFRSAFERTFQSEIYDGSISGYLTGFDFGQVYSFEPLVGIMLQVGILGLVALYFITQRSMSSFGFSLFIFSISPQMWYYPAWGAIGVFVAAIVMAGAKTS